MNKKKSIKEIKIIDADVGVNRNDFATTQTMNKVQEIFNCLWSIIKDKLN